MISEYIEMNSELKDKLVNKKLTVQDVLKYIIESENKFYIECNKTKDADDLQLNDITIDYEYKIIGIGYKNNDLILHLKTKSEIEAEKLLRENMSNKKLFKAGTKFYTLDGVLTIK